MIPYGRQSIDKNDIKAVVDVMKSDWLTQGPDILTFEKSLAEYCGAKFAVVCTNGTAALHLAYMAAGLKRGDEIITTPNTFVATTNMMLAVGARPIFCDIRLDTYNIDEDKIEALITLKTKAIVPVHFAGQPCEMDKISRIAKKNKLIIIEDACHALGASYKGKKIGSCFYSDMAVFSFHPVKSITTGEGGAILTNSVMYYEKLISLRSHGIHKDKKGKNVMSEFGYNYRMTDFQAALGSSQIKKIDSFIKRRTVLANCYFQNIQKTDYLIVPAQVKNANSAFHLFIVKASNYKIREELVKHLQQAGIGTNYHYPCVYKHPYYKQNGYKKSKCWNAENYEQTAVTIPLFPDLKNFQIKYICQTINNFLNEKNGKAN
jgi:perosamine synthetase